MQPLRWRCVHTCTCLWQRRLRAPKGKRPRLSSPHAPRWVHRCRRVRTDTYSKGKYARVISEVGGWAWFQRLLGALRLVADKHGTSISNVAARWVLQRQGVAGVILGARNASHVQVCLRVCVHACVCGGEVQ